MGQARRGGEPVATTTEIELPIDFNAMDETGLPWAFLDEAADPSRVVPESCTSATCLARSRTTSTCCNAEMRALILHRGVCQIFWQIR
jgi:hypothetical protein